MWFNSQPKIVALQDKHVSQVLDLIESHDDDDAEAAEISFRRNGIKNHFVLLDRKGIIGVSGFTRADDANQTYWLSWTYVATDRQGKGFGNQLVYHVLDAVSRAGGRKVYVGASDYKDERGKSVYEAAHKFYQCVGFKQQLFLEDYYDKDENRIVYCLDMESSAAGETADVTEWRTDHDNLKCTEAFELLESDGAYALTWEIVEEDGEDGVASVDINGSDIESVIESVRNNKGHSIFVALPSSSVRTLARLERSGFKQLGVLPDYYDQGINEVHLGYSI